jgi:hypothetical protein
MFSISLKTLRTPWTAKVITVTKSPPETITVAIGPLHTSHQADHVQIILFYVPAAAFRLRTFEPVLAAGAGPPGGNRNLFVRFHFLLFLHSHGDARYSLDRIFRKQSDRAGQHRGNIYQHDITIACRGMFVHRDIAHFNRKNTLGPGESPGGKESCP